MEKYVCIHGHFYQPPRENPWLEAVEQQDSAYPYHDWNERITEECYASNGASRILNDKKQIKKIVNNYEKISFNFGPTILSWLADKSPDVYQSIIQADKESRTNFDGHGNAIAQSYNHSILPLCNTRDKYTQIVWGIRDFNYRFERQPEGLWLPETGVDLETLQIMAEKSILFTILAPRQAKRIRKIGSSNWHDVSNGQIDPSMAYLLQLKNNHKIILFFYDGPVSQEVAFSGVLNSGENLANRLMSIFSDSRHHPQLAHIATDGETYGHHHAHGDMALSYALNYIETNNLAKITNYSQFLHRFPPTHEVEIFENSSWSCIHGIERWKSSCGCNTGLQSGWNQDWRAPLRESLDWLRDYLIPIYEEKARNFFKDPWDARNHYIEIILNRSEKNLAHFFNKFATHALNDLEQQSALKLLEMQRNAMLMYTSCGWFFDDLSGIETVQIISYAARAIQLAEKFFNAGIEKQFEEKLANAHSNLKNMGDGRTIYEKFVKPAMLDWYKIGAHYAISSIFQNYASKTKIYCYEVESKDIQKNVSGNLQLILGNGTFKSIITTEEIKLSYAAVHFGDQNINCGVCDATKINDFHKTSQELTEAFERGDLIAVNNYLSKHFGDSFSLSTLFRDEQRWVLNQILKVTLEDVEAAYQQLYQRYITLMRFIENLNIPLSGSLRATAEHVINSEINTAFSKEKIKVTHILKLIKESEMAKIKLNPSNGFTLRNNLENIMQRIHQDPHSLAHIEHLTNAMKIVAKLPFGINLFKIQNSFYDLLENFYPEMKKKAESGDHFSHQWLEHFSILGDRLSVQV